MKVRVMVDAWERQTEYAKEQYGDWSAEGGINGVEVCRAKADERYGVFEAEGVSVGSYVFPVVAHYGTGDSFGHCSGGQFQVVAVATSPEEADEIKKVCELYTNDRVGYEEFVKSQQGLTKLPKNSRLDRGLVIKGQEVYPYWTGYFESLNEIKIWTCRVNA